MKRYILFACLTLTLTSCKNEISEKEIIKSETNTSSSTNQENPLQNKLEESISDPRVKIVKIDDNEVSKEEALKIQMTNVKSIKHIIHKSDSVTLEIKLAKK